MLAIRSAQFSVQRARLSDPSRGDVSRFDSAPGRAERFDPEAGRLNPVRPAVEAGLLKKLLHEFAAVGELPPDARQEQRAPAARAENEAVAVGLERSCELSLAPRRNRSG